MLSIVMQQKNPSVPLSIQKVQRNTVGSALACCKAGPRSILGSAPHRGSSLAERRSDEDTRGGLGD
jgi:hypothetical protein